MQQVMITDHHSRSGKHASMVLTATGTGLINNMVPTDQLFLIFAQLDPYSKHPAVCKLWCEVLPYEQFYNIEKVKHRALFASAPMFKGPAGTWRGLRRQHIAGL